MNLIVDRFATKQIETIFQWYEELQHGLGLDFIDELTSTFESIKTFPNIGVRARGRTRKVLLRKFPYKVFYKIHNKRVVVYSVFHHRQKQNIK